MNYSLTIQIADTQVALAFDNDRLYQQVKARYKTVPMTAPHFTIRVHNTNTTLSFHSPCLSCSTKGDVPFDFINFVLKLVIELNLLQQDILLLHGSSVVIDQKGYGFIGPSGVGKTTLVANLGHDPAKQIYSEDCAVIKKIKNSFWLFSSPFDYKCRYAWRPENRPIAHLYLLKQAQQIRVAPLSLTAQLAHLIPQVTYFMFIVDPKVKTESG